VFVGRYPRLSLSEPILTVRPNRRPEGNQYILGARNTACWDNSTVDFGFHDYRDYPQRFWMEVHQLPLSPTSPFAPRRGRCVLCATSPSCLELGTTTTEPVHDCLCVTSLFHPVLWCALLGRYCLDDSCLHLADESSLSVSDTAFDYDSQAYNLRRPVPCPPGMYCHPGTAVDISNRMNYSTPQPCFESMFCPEGSETPRGLGDCAPGFYCPFGKRLPCPVGTYCPDPGAWDPTPCPPGTYSAQVSQIACLPCPVGYICPGFGRVDPAICPPGFICSITGLDSPNLICPAGFYCSNGTLTSQPFRNDTTLRPYPCRPGTYCSKGVGFDRVKVLDFLYAQPCTEGFFCEAASTSPVVSTICHGTACVSFALQAAWLNEDFCSM
jgi:hypothetical protein